MEKRILILEDEEVAGQKLVRWISRIRPHATVHWKKTIEDGKVFYASYPVDLIVSDIELLDGNVFTWYEKDPPSCPIIFCTAYDDYYHSAFQTNGIQYLLKPYSETQLQSALDKYDRLYQSDHIDYETLLRHIEKSAMKTTSPFKTHFTIKKRQGIFLLETKDIAYCQAKGDFVLAITRDGHKHPISTTLSQLLSELDPSHFFQINRSEIVALSSIHYFATYNKSRLVVYLKAPQEALYTSTSRTSDFRKWVERDFK